MGKRTGLRLRFREEQLRQLRSTLRPALDADGLPVLKNGYATLVPNPAGTPWRFLEAGEGSPRGFGVYVGKGKATYEVQRRIHGRVMRFALGDTRELRLDEARDLAVRKLRQAREKNAHPNVVQGFEAEAQLDDLTVNEALERYRRKLEDRSRPAKASTLTMLRRCQERLDRPEVGVGGRRLRDLTDDAVATAFKATRLSCALHSNRVPEPVKAEMRKRGQAQLPDEVLRDLGILSASRRLRINAAGVTAAEQTFVLARRAADDLIKERRIQAERTDARPLLRVNPFHLVGTRDLLRTARDLRDYFNRAKVRNPLGEGDGSLGAAIEYLWSRRHAQRGQNTSGVYYLLTTLLLGARRNETAKLAWFDRVPEDLREVVSWVWLPNMTPDSGGVNPTTQLPGPQVFFARTKNGEDHRLPLAPFALALMQRRFEQRLPTSDARAQWVFPARSPKAKEGHYKDSKALMRGLGELLQERAGSEFAPTPHDLRRTLGRYAQRLGLSDNLTSRLLNHQVRSERRGAESTVRYQDPEWQELLKALERIEQLMAANAPAFYNELKPLEWAPIAPSPPKGS